MIEAIISMSYRLKAKTLLRRHQTHVFTFCRICVLLLLVLFLQFLQWSIDQTHDKPPGMQKSSQNSSYLTSLRRKLYSRSARVVEFFELNLSDIKKKIEVPWYSSCLSECNSDRGWGICDDVRCICNPGFGDNDCSFSIEVLYSNHMVYETYSPRALDLSGWDLGGDLYKLLVEHVVPNLVIEVGVWKGCSALKLAQAIKDQGSGVLVAVDTWLPILEFWENHDVQNRMQDLYLQHGYPDIFHTFVSNVIHQNLTEVVIPFPATSEVAFDFFTRRKTQAEIIHIDASHEYKDVVVDVKHWWTILRNGGILLGDAWSLAWPGVLKTVRQHAKRYKLEINVYRNKWWIQKPLHYTQKN